MARKYAANRSRQRSENELTLSAPFRVTFRRICASLNIQSSAMTAPPSAAIESTYRLRANLRRNRSHSNPPPPLTSFLARQELSAIALRQRVEPLSPFR